MDTKSKNIIGEESYLTLLMIFRLIIKKIIGEESSPVFSFCGKGHKETSFCKKKARDGSG